MVVLPPSVDCESPATNEASPALADPEAPASNESDPPNKSPEPTVRAMSPADADVESPVAIDTSPEFEVEALPVDRLRLPLEDPALLPAASAVFKLAAPELESSLMPDVMEMSPPPVDAPEPAEICTEPP